MDQTKDPTSTQNPTNLSANDPHQDVPPPPADNPPSTPVPEPITHNTDIETPRTETANNPLLNQNQPANPPSSNGAATPPFTPASDTHIVPPGPSEPPSTSKKKKLVGAIIALVLLLIAIPAGIFLVQKTQELREKAVGEDCNATITGIADNPLPNTTFPVDVTLNWSNAEEQCNHVSLRVDGVPAPGQPISGACVGGTYRYTVNSGTPGAHTIEFAVNDTALYPDVTQIPKSVCATATFTTVAPPSPSPSPGASPSPVASPSPSASASPRPPSPSPSASPIASPSPSASPVASPSPSASPASGGPATQASPSPSAATQAQAPGQTQSGGSQTKASTKPTPTPEAKLPEAGINIPTGVAAMGGLVLLLLGLALAL